MISIAGVELEVFERGQGAPMLYLHGGAGIGLDLPFLDLLAKERRVIAPSHPGFGKSSLPDWLDSIDDIAHIYLELMDRLRPGAGRSRRLLDRRLDRRRDRDQGAGAAQPPGADRSGRRQDRHARQARHSRCLRHAAGQARPAALPRSRARIRSTSRRMSDEELAHRRPQQRDAGAADLGAVHAQSQAQASPAPRERADACSCAARATASSPPTISSAMRRSFPRRGSRPSRTRATCRMSSSARRPPRRFWNSCNS